MEEIHCIVHGKVQGVFFRDFVCKHAESLHLKGWVKNQYGGTVEIVAQGPKTDLERFLGHVRHGSSSARVSEVEVEWEKLMVPYTSFEVVL